jgi:rubrerythrin
MSAHHDDPRSDASMNSEIDEAVAPVRRSQFLTTGVKGGLALMVGGSVLALAACGDDEDTAGGSTSTPTVTTGTGTAGSGGGDVDIAKLAATAELLAVDFYGMGIKSGFFAADVLAYMNAAQQNEQDHYDALAKVLGAEAPSNLTFTYPEGTFASAKSIADTGAALEEAFVGAYEGAVSALSDPGLKVVAAQIAANEAQHLTTLKSLAAGGTLVPNPSLPKVLTAEQATEAVTPFLG